MKIKRGYDFTSMMFVLILLIFICLIIINNNNNNNVRSATSNDKGTEAERIIYLTFDDGPSIITDKILDILKEHNIKATFFLIGNQIED